MPVVAAANFQMRSSVTFFCNSVTNTVLRTFHEKKKITTSDILLVYESLEMYYSVRFKSRIHSVVKTEGFENKCNSAETYFLFR